MLFKIVESHFLNLGSVDSADKFAAEECLDNKACIHPRLYRNDFQSVHLQDSVEFCIGCKCCRDSLQLCCNLLSVIAVRNGVRGIVCIRRDDTDACGFQKREFPRDKRIQDSASVKNSRLRRIGYPGNRGDAEFVFQFNLRDGVSFYHCNYRLDARLRVHRSEQQQEKKGEVMFHVFSADSSV